jgi:hypothetical protein
MKHNCWPINTSKWDGINTPRISMQYYPSTLRPKPHESTDTVFRVQVLLSVLIDASERSQQRPPHRMYLVRDIPYWTFYGNLVQFIGVCMTNPARILTRILTQVPRKDLHTGSLRGSSLRILPRIQILARIPVQVRILTQDPCKDPPFVWH